MYIVTKNYFWEFISYFFSYSYDLDSMTWSEVQHSEDSQVCYTLKIRLICHHKLFFNNGTYLGMKANYIYSSWCLGLHSFSYNFFHPWRGNKFQVFGSNLNPCLWIPNSLLFVNFWFMTIYYICGSILFYFLDSQSPFISCCCCC